MKTYDGWKDRVRGPVCRVTDRRRHYWLPRRSDLLTWEQTGDRVDDLETRWLWVLAVDILADATGVDELALRAAADLVRELSDYPRKHDEWLLFEEHLHAWTVSWVARELGLLPGREEVARG